MEPTAALGEDPRLQPLIAYLEQHRGQINIEARRKQLVEAAHPPELVDAAVQRMTGAQSSLPLAWPLGLLLVRFGVCLALFVGFA